MIDSLSLECVRCGARQPAKPISFNCPFCWDEAPSNLSVSYHRDVLEGVDRDKLAALPSGLWRYSHSLPVDPADAVSLGEGDTPLVPLPSLAVELGLTELWGKAEYANPTGSFKDRLASLAVSSGKSLFGAKVIATSSSGNAGAAAAAYAARAGMPCVVFSFGASTEPMITQMRSYGASVVMVEEKAHRWLLLNEGVRRLGWFPTSPFFAPAVGSNPFGIEGYKSIAYELVWQRDWQVPDWIVLPVCYGDALFGIWKGFSELRDLGWIKRIPRLVAAEIYGSLEAALDENSDTIPSMSRAHDTVAISIGATQGTYQSLFAIRQSGGRAVSVADEELLYWHRELATREGVFIEPSAAATFAAIDSLKKSGTIKRHHSVICLLTATGLKDIHTASRSLEPPPVVPLDLSVTLDTIANHYHQDLT